MVSMSASVGTAASSCRGLAVDSKVGDEAAAGARASGWRVVALAGVASAAARALRPPASSSDSAVALLPRVLLLLRLRASATRLAATRCASAARDCAAVRAAAAARLEAAAFSAAARFVAARSAASARCCAISRSARGCGGGRGSTCSGRGSTCGVDSRGHAAIPPPVLLQLLIPGGRGRPRGAMIASFAARSSSSS